MSSKNLTIRAVETLKPRSDRYEVSDGGGPLRIVVQPNGKKSWALRYRHDGRPRKMTFGPFPQLSLADARDMTRDALSAVAKGRDPGAEKISARRRSREDVKALSERWIEARHRGRSRDRYIGEIQRTLKNHVYPHIGSRDAASIERSDILDLLDRAAKQGRLVPNHVLSVVRPLFVWAVERGAIAASPAAGIRTPASAKPRDRVLVDTELAAFMVAVNGIGEPWTDYLELLALTAQRRNEVAGMTWNEVDLKTRRWTIAAERTKNGVAHVIPLAPRAVRILKSREGNGEGFVFPAGRSGEGHVSGFGKMKKVLDAKILAALRDAENKRGGKPDKIKLINWTLHDLRRTAATNMAALGHPIHVVERILNHLSGATTGGIVAVYQRHDYLDERRKALEAWAKHLKGVKL